MKETTSSSSGIIRVKVNAEIRNINTKNASQFEQ